MNATVSTATNDTSTTGAVQTTSITDVQDESSNNESENDVKDENEEYFEGLYKYYNFDLKHGSNAYSHNINLWFWQFYSLNLNH